MPKLVFTRAVILILIIISAGLYAQTTIVKMNGTIHVRRGLEETWHPAKIGDKLNDMDTILSEEGHVVLQRADGSTFSLGPHSYLDISDLRAISRQEMFLFIMSQKIQNMPLRKNSSLRSENISSVHGQKQTLDLGREPAPVPSWKQELNAALALYDQDYLTNAVIKLHKVLNRYANLNDCGLVHLYLGKSFEALDETGQAIDNYHYALEEGGECHKAEVIDESQAAIRRLSK